jgi:uncharacterized membrane protein YgaE (UPF0421/DUF939 family)
LYRRLGQFYRRARSIVRSAVLDAAGRVRTGVWPVLQRTIAATAAWMIARHLVEHHQPFFAPIAAVVALNTTRGGRGRNAIQFLQGVVAGIVVAELAVLILGFGYVALAVATFVAMLVALVLGGGGIVIAQAAAGAILTVTTAAAGTGSGRLIDALIGAGVALVISQLLFPAEPIRLLHRAETAALSNMADGLDLAARALERDDDELANQAVDRLRQVRDHLTDLAQTRESSKSSARDTPIWWRRRASIHREYESAGHLDLLGTSCLMLTRIVADADGAQRAQLSSSVRRVAVMLDLLARTPGGHQVRRKVTRQALAAVRELPGDSDDSGTPAVQVVARWALHRVATDTLMFAGVEAGRATEAIKQGADELDIPTPPTPAGERFSHPRRYWNHRAD